MNDPGDPQNKDRTGISQNQLRAILLGWDSLGVASIPEAQDKNDCMISPLMYLLHEGSDEQSLCSWITNEVKGPFGMRSDPSKEAALAHSLAVWWTRRTSEP